ncbi:MAG: sensor histidine kinase [Candidatus Muiribacteriaceae bacterium]
MKKNKTEYEKRIKKLEKELAFEKQKSEYFRDIAIKAGNENVRDLFELRNSIKKLEQSKAHIDSLVRKAIESDRIKSEFLSMMSHEIRTPMTSLLGFLTLLEQSDLNEKQEFFLKKISRSAEYLFEIINNIQDMARIEAGNIELVKNRFDMASIFVDIHHMFAKFSNQKKDVSFNVLSPDPGKAIIFSDPKRVRQICFNLVSNAVKFTDRGFINIYYNIEDSHFSFIVEDSGPGIPEDKIESIFEKFTQLDTSLNRRHYGMGIGLTIADRLCRMLDAKIKVSSLPGQGSCFRILLPCT